MDKKELVSVLDQSLRQTRNAENRLIGRLNEVEDEAQRLRTEIDALNYSAEKTEDAILALLKDISDEKVD